MEVTLGMMLSDMPVVCRKSLLTLSGIFIRLSLWRIACTLAGGAYGLKYVCSVDIGYGSSSYDT